MTGLKSHSQSVHWLGLCSGRQILEGTGPALRFPTCLVPCVAHSKPRRHLRSRGLPRRVVSGMIKLFAWSPKQITLLLQVCLQGSLTTILMHLFQRYLEGGCYTINCSPFTYVFYIYAQQGGDQSMSFNSFLQYLFSEQNPQYSQAGPKGQLVHLCAFRFIHIQVEESNTYCQVSKELQRG